jgi:hypothetical protein
LLDAVTVPLLPLVFLQSCVILLSVFLFSCQYYWVVFLPAALLPSVFMSSCQFSCLHSYAELLLFIFLSFSQFTCFISVCCAAPICLSFFLPVLLLPFLSAELLRSVFLSFCPFYCFHSCLLNYYCLFFFLLASLVAYIYVC